ncbi:MAG: Wzt carbohydrate-binding domain-containing protein, partial [Polyangiales bacterium]
AYSAYMNYDAPTVDGPKALAPAPEAPSKPAVDSVWHDVANCSSFGDRGAEVTRVAFSRKGEGASLDVLLGNEEVEFAMEVLFHRDMADPLYGILIKDTYGNQILSINSFVYEFATVPRKAGERVVFRFAFRFPLIRNGEYSISCAIAEGTQDVHVEHHWVHDALIVQVANRSLKNSLGCYLVVEEVALSEASG